MNKKYIISIVLIFTIFCTGLFIILNNLNDKHNQKGVKEDIEQLGKSTNDEIYEWVTSDLVFDDKLISSQGSRVSLEHQSDQVIVSYSTYIRSDYDDTKKVKLFVRIYDRHYDTNSYIDLPVFNKEKYVLYGLVPEAYIFELEAHSSGHYDMLFIDQTGGLLDKSSRATMLIYTFEILE